MRIRVLVATLAIALIGTTGCMEEPNPVGVGLLKDDRITVDSSTVVAKGSSTIRKFPTYRGPTTILLGAESSIQTEAWAWIKFSPLADTLQDVTLLSASVELKGSYAFGNTSSALSFDVHEGLKNWHTDPIIEDDSLSLHAIQAGTYYKSGVTPSVSTILPNDTAIVSIPLDTALVRQWVNAISDTSKKNFGIVLEPTNNSLVRGFRSFRDIEPRNSPKLVLIYKRTPTSNPDTVRIDKGTDRFLARVSPTTRLSDSTTTTIRNGVSYRAVLDFQNVLIPKNYAVHRAMLEVTLEDSTALNDYTTHTLYAYFMTESGVVENLLSPSEVGTLNGQKVYRFIVSNFVHFWGRGMPVRTIAIGGATEQNTIDVFALHGPGSSNIASRPKLIITYTEFR